MKKVYLVRAAQFYKIGISGNVQKRIASIQTGCPIRCEYVGYMPTINAELLEKELHLRFHDCRTWGEWFDLGDDNIRILIRDFNLKYTINPFAETTKETERTSGSDVLKEARGIAADTSEFMRICSQYYPEKSLTAQGKELVNKLIQSYGFDVVAKSIQYLSVRFKIEDALNKLKNACKTYSNYGRFVDDKTWSLYFSVISARGKEDASLVLTYIMENKMDLRDDWDEFAAWVMSMNDYDENAEHDKLPYLNMINFHKAESETYG